MSFPEIGEERKADTFFNIILPFFLVIYEHEKNDKMLKFLNSVYEYHSPLSPNSITKKMLKELCINNVESAKEFMGLIQLYYEKQEVSHG